jgi:hypothetical protein
VLDPCRVANLLCILGVLSRFLLRLREQTPLLLLLLPGKQCCRGGGWTGVYEKTEIKNQSQVTNYPCKCKRISTFLGISPLRIPVHEEFGIRPLDDRKLVEFLAHVHDPVPKLRFLRKMEMKRTKHQSEIRFLPRMQRLSRRVLSGPSLQYIYICNNIYMYIYTSSSEYIYI